MINDNGYSGLYCCCLRINRYFYFFKYLPFLYMENESQVILERIFEPRLTIDSRSRYVALIGAMSLSYTTRAATSVIKQDLIGRQSIRLVVQRTSLEERSMSRLN